MAREVIGLFLRSLENDYQQRLRDDALGKASHLGLKVQMFSANNDPARQAAQIDKAVGGAGAAQLAAVLVSPVYDEALAEPARAATAAGIGWALLNREAGYLDALRQEHPGLPIFSATPDQVEIGRLQGRQSRACLPRGGQVLYITGPSSTSSARRRLQGMREELGDDAWKLTLLEGDWTSEGARLALDRWFETEHATPGV